MIGYSIDTVFCEEVSSIFPGFFKNWQSIFTKIKTSVVMVIVLCVRNYMLCKLLDRLLIMNLQNDFFFILIQIQIKLWRKKILKYIATHCPCWKIIIIASIWIVVTKMMIKPSKRRSFVPPCIAHVPFSDEMCFVSHFLKNNYIYSRGNKNHRQVL